MNAQFSQRKSVTDFITQKKDNFVLKYAGAHFTIFRIKCKFFDLNFQSNSLIEIFFEKRLQYFRAMSDLQELSAVLNSELEVLLSESDASDEVKNYLKNYSRRLLLRNFFKWFILILIFITIGWALIYYIPILNWNASAIGRLALIKLVLPYYDWQHFYKSRCLVEKPRDETSKPKDEYKGYSEFGRDECAVCENLGNGSDVTYGI